MTWAWCLIAPEGGVWRDASPRGQRQQPPPKAPPPAEAPPPPSQPAAARRRSRRPRRRRRSPAPARRRSPAGSPARRASDAPPDRAVACRRRSHAARHHAISAHLRAAYFGERPVRPRQRASWRYVPATPRASVDAKGRGGPQRLTWSLTPHSPAAAPTGRRRWLSPDAAGAPAWRPSPPRSPGGPDGGQGLPLSRTMLSNHGLPYVGRFACDWHRLATTDPLRSDRQATARLGAVTSPAAVSDPPGSGPDRDRPPPRRPSTATRSRRTGSGRTAGPGRRRLLPALR